VIPARKTLDFSKRRREKEPRSAVKPARRGKDPLVGRFFHTWKADTEGKRQIQYQGQIVARVRQLYLVQFFSWLDGCPTNEELWSFDMLKQACFYKTRESWNHAGGLELRRRHGRTS
jgi:hypothetical protein